MDRGGPLHERVGELEDERVLLLERIDKLEGFCRKLFDYLAERDESWVVKDRLGDCTDNPFAEEEKDEPVRGVDFVLDHAGYRVPLGKLNSY
jgi:hypothetical protein